MWGWGRNTSIAAADWFIAPLGLAFYFFLPSSCVFRFFCVDKVLIVSNQNPQYRSITKTTVIPTKASIQLSLDSRRNLSRTRFGTRMTIKLFCPLTSDHRLAVSPVPRFVPQCLVVFINLHPAISNRKSLNSAIRNYLLSDFRRLTLCSMPHALCSMPYASNDTPTLPLLPCH
jgi:hypothetical protein